MGNPGTLLNPKSIMFRTRSGNSRLLLSLSLILSLVTIAAVAWINIQIAERYEAATGKTRALFGIIELTYGYKYYFIAGGLLAIIPGIIAARHGQRRFGLLAILLAVAAIVSVFFRLWTLLVDRSV